MIRFGARFESRSPHQPGKPAGNGGLFILCTKIREAVLKRILLPAVILWMTLPASASMSRYFTGNFKDVKQSRLHGPVLDLAGGGADVEPAFQQIWSISFAAAPIATRRWMWSFSVHRGPMATTPGITQCTESIPLNRS